MRCDKNMARNYLRKIAIAICLCCAFTIVNFQQLDAQVLGTETSQVKWLATGALRSWISNMGAEGEYFRRDRLTFVNSDQIDGLCWPNEFNIRMKGVRVCKTLWIGSSNFTDPLSNATYPYKVVCIGKDAAYSGTEVFADEFSLEGKFLHPSVYVDNTRASARDFDDAVDKVDNTQVTDRIINNSFHLSNGVSVTRKILSFSQQYHNNYYIYDYTFKNTGIIDESRQKKTNDTLTGVIFYMQTRLSFCGVSYTGIGTQSVGSWFTGGASWGFNTINDVIREDVNPAGEFRASISYWGPQSTTPYGSPAGDIGLPGPSSTNVTELAGYEFAGTVVLHADKSANDTTDDITQPTTTQYVAADYSIDRNGGSPTQYNQNLMAQKYTRYMAAGHGSATMADQVGKDANGWPTGPGNGVGSYPASGDPGGYMCAQGFGPYTLAPGDSIHIVLAEAVAGINWNKGCEVARNWFANNTSAFVLPKGYKNGGTTADRNEYKNAWVFSGKDSLFQTFRRARTNYQNNYVISQPPSPPDKFEVNSGGDRIKISWSNSAEGSPHFDGYRLYRSEGKTDTTYDLIFECGKGTNSYDDQNAKRGFNYYYYIQSKDDGSTNPGNTALNIPAGEPLVSSRYYTMTNNPAYLTRPAGAGQTFISDTVTFQGNDTTTHFILPISVADSTGTVVKGVSVTVNGVRQIPASYTISANTQRLTSGTGANVTIRPDTLVFVKAPLGTIKVMYISPVVDQSSVVLRNYALSAIRVVPNPWNIHARNIQYGTADPTTMDRLGFYNLPPMCKIKIYTELGDLVATINHNNGSGDDYWQSLTSSRQVVVSGLYIAYFEVTENSSDGHYRKGDSIFKKFIIIR